MTETLKFKVRLGPKKFGNLTFCIGKRKITLRDINLLHHEIRELTSEVENMEKNVEDEIFVHLTDKLKRNWLLYINKFGVLVNIQLLFVPNDKRLAELVKLEWEGDFTEFRSSVKTLCQMTMIKYFFGYTN